jgi:hypothetical protein
MMSTKLQGWRPIMIAAVLGGGAIAIAGGCGDGETPPPVVDGGPGDGGGDTIPPEVQTTVPVDGETEVPLATAIRVVFSEPVVLATGAIEVSADGAALTFAASATSPTEIRVAPESAWPTNAAISVMVSSFEDEAGNAMSGTHAFLFTTRDPVAPTVLSATPAEGAIGVGLDVGTIVIELSEPMNAALGVAVLEGGPGDLGTLEWEGSRLTIPVTGLAASTEYALELVGFADAAGNALDGSVYLGDGKLDFATGEDTVAPIVTESSPSEGQTGVPPTRTTRVRVVFSEPMDTSAGDATLEIAGEDTALEASWAGDGTILLLDVGGLLEPDIAYRLSLAGFADAAGNPLDAATYLGDGVLDFTTGGDELPPFVLSTNPLEGATSVRWTTSRIFVTFSETMDTSITDVPVDDGVSTTTLTGTWSSGGALLELDVSGQLVSGRSYTLDFTGFADADGAALDAAHPYLGDGRLSFTMTDPVGENCQDYFTNAHATTTPEGALEWTFANDSVSNVDGAAPCDASGGSPDAVVRYTKSSPSSTDATGAGRVIRITASTTATTSPNLNLDVLADSCDPTSSVASTDRLACETDAQPQVVELDVPAGDYYIWVASSAAIFRGATITVEELPAGPGDTCNGALPVTAGTTAISPSGTLDFNSPSCAAGALTWYRYTATENAAFVQVNGIGAVAVIDASTGREAGCADDTVTRPLGAAVTAGSDVCIAVRSGPGITSLVIDEVPYTGVRGEVTHLGIERPAGSIISPNPSWLVVDATTLYGGRLSGILTAPISGGVALVETAVPSTQVGNAALLHGGAIFSLDNSTTSAERLYRLTPDGAGGFTSTAWDTGSAYAGGTEALAWDGTQLIVANYSGASTTAPTIFYAVDPTTAGPAVELGRNDTLREVSGMAADATWLYVVATVAGDEGLFRLRRSELGTPAAAPEVLYQGENLSDRNAAVLLDNPTAPTVLYFRTYPTTNAVYALLQPASATPRLFGPLLQLGRTGDNAMTLDPTGSALYVYETTTTTQGNYVRVE